MTIGCPLCHRRLQLPNALERTQVQCPLCGHAFEASQDLLVRIERMDPPVVLPRTHPTERLEVDRPELGPSQEEDTVPCPECRAFVRSTLARCRACGYQLRGPNGEVYWTRRDAEPHRRGLVLMIGLTSMAISVLALPATLISWGAFRLPVGIVLAPLGLTLGIVGWVMGGHDLVRMRNGAMDDEGYGRTMTGRQCALMGIIFSLLCNGSCGLGMLSMWLLRR